MGIFKIGLSFSGFAIPILWEICMAIDALIYEVADQALRAFFKMAELSANVQAYSAEISYILSRVMVLAGVYALFRLAVMLINYLIDPNKVKELSKDGKSIVKNIILAVVLLIASPIIFSTLGEFQKLVIEQDVIPKIVYGPDSFNENENENSIPQQSARFVNNAFLLFFSPSKEARCNPDAVASSPEYCQIYVKVSNADKKPGSNESYGVSSLTGYASSKYFDYMPFVSGIVGMMLVYYFVIFAIELGKRIIKLVILQVVSPIPIIMSVDPSQKNKLNNFIKAYSGIYLQIFIRIITMYLAFVVLALITNFEGFDSLLNSGMLMEAGVFIKVLLYIGVFQAMKELPKLIEDAIGVKMGEAPGKGFGAVLGGILGGAAGLAGGAVAGGLSGGIGGAFAGAGSGLVSGAMGVAASKNAAAGVSAAVAAIGKSHKLGGAVAGAGGFFPFMLGGLENKIGGVKRDAATLKDFDDKIQGKDKDIEGFNKRIGDINKDISTQNKLMDTRTRADQLRTNFENAFATQHGDLNSWLANDKDYMSARELLSQSTDSQDRGYLQQQLNENRARVELSYNAARDKYFEDNFNQIYLGGAADETFAEALNEYNEYVSQNGMEDRIIGSYRGENDGISAVDAINEIDKQAIQDKIDSYQSDIRKEEDKIKTAEADKKRMAEEKKAFENSPEYTRRNKRSEEPKYKPRNTSGK